MELEVTVRQATGATIQAEDLEKERQFYITEYGAIQGGEPVKNTKAINAAIEAAAQVGGGTVVIPNGEFKTYTIRLQSHVNLYLDKGAVIRAARTDIKSGYEPQIGEGGNYDEPEVNRYAGLEDHGHAYFANSLVYGADLKNIMIYGEGRFDGSCYDEEGYRQYVLMGGDPAEPDKRSQKGHKGEWFGNKGIALVRCENVVLKDFSFVIGGHFAIITEGVENLLVDHILVDTTRDAIDVDCCQNVTIRNSVFNSLTDDALVMKASFGAGKYMPLKNVLIEDCTVSGFDAGSVFHRTYTRDKLVATDRCGPTGRVKLGTESTCGYECVTVRRVHFQRSRGFALEAVDGSDLSHILMEDCTMDDVSSSPIFIRAGERGRFPVTGCRKEDDLVAHENNVRLDQRNWVLPMWEDEPVYEAKRFTPSYQKNQRVTVDGHSYFNIVDAKEPTRINYTNVHNKDGQWYPITYDREKHCYVPDEKKPLQQRELAYYANACGYEKPAFVHDIIIRRVRITNADPRYPMLIMGLKNSRIENVQLEQIQVEFRGGMTMEHAVEQRQLNTNRKYTQYETKPSIQTLPWLVNTFFLKEEGLLPRVSWNAEENEWQDNPYLVPELPAVYPEPSNWGILPAYGLYARHVKNLCVRDVEMSTRVLDERHAVVLEDTERVVLEQVSTKNGKEERYNSNLKDAQIEAELALITNHYARPTNYEYVLEEPYHITTIKDWKAPKAWRVKEVQLTAPAPGTPLDSYYSYPTTPIPENGYFYKVPTEDYPLPLTVYRPFVTVEGDLRISVGQETVMKFIVHHPACEATMENGSMFIYNEAVENIPFVVEGENISTKLTIEGLPAGANYDEKERKLYWLPKEEQVGEHRLSVILDDGILEEKHSFVIEVCVQR